ncbi:hypothetical protein ELI15_14190 [Rhizobium ruizarguesonis]|uniref:hypothetical protein n=1 Tax=Rhizobium ruizarguesonis TaxID=2081791 RepID=UPI00102F6388|nr:hypothetical protein [Rhizobium ruizarguesonis]TAW65440.1 hypothetical protein ELI15_14190 [Rhizobium ruizarguesonis]
MALGTITRSIGTTFTVSGISSAAAGLRSFAGSARTNMQSVQASVAAAFRPLASGTRQIARISFVGIERSAKLAFKGVAIAAAGAVAKIAAIGGAAYRSSKDIAELMNQVSKDSRRLGMSAENVSLFRGYFEKNGVDADEVLSTLTDNFNEFQNISKQMAQQSKSLVNTQATSYLQAVTSAAKNDIDGVKTAVDAVTSERMKNLDYVEGRLAFLKDQLQSRDEITASSSTDPFGRVGYRNNASELLGGYKEIKDLEAARAQIRTSFGQQGEALFTLKDYGLNMDQALKGGLEGFSAISDAFKRIEEPATRVHVAMQLFGEDAGAKMVTVLEGGRSALEDYRKEMDRLGGTVTTADAKLGADYSDSFKRLELAVRGVRLEIARGLLPLMIESQGQLTEWLVKNRTVIADYMKAGFIVLRNFFLDVVGLINGQRVDFRSGFFRYFSVQIVWVSSLVKDLREQVGLIFDGKDSKWEWLNMTRDGFQAVARFATDAFRVLTGGYAENFDWMNKAKAQFDIFVGKFKDAWKMFMDVITTIHTAFQKVTGLFNIDATTTVLFLGMLRFTGVLGGITTAIGLLGGGIGRLFALGAGGSALGGALGGIGATIASIMSGLGLVAAGVGVAVAGYAYISKKSDESSDRVLAKQSELARIQAEPGLQARELWKWNNDTEYRYAATNKALGTKLMSPKEMADQSGGIIDVAGDYGPAGGYISGKRVAELGIFNGDRLGGRTGEVEPTQTVVLKLQTDNGSGQLTVNGDQGTIGLLSDLQRRQRTGR